MKTCKNCRSFSCAEYHKKTGWCMKRRKVVNAKSSCDGWKSTSTPKYEMVVHPMNVTGRNWD